MIQLSRPVDGLSVNVSIIKLNLKDKISSDFDTDDGLLISFQSQFTGKIKTTKPVANWGADFYNERMVSLFVYVSSTYDTLTSGIIKMGTRDFPLGFYDVTIYQNDDSANLDPTGLSVLYNGLANLTADNAAASPVYSDYTTNDSDTESVYITLD